MPFEVLTMGRVGVDVYPLQTGVGLAEVTSFGKYLGGSPANVAVAAARYGRRAAVITKTGRDPFGDFVRSALRGYGVDRAHVGTSDIAPTPVTFCEIFPPDDFPLYFYRLPKAPDLDLRPDELDLAAVRGAAVFWMTGTGLSEEPSRSATLTALRHRARAGTTVFDLDWRPVFWSDPATARTYYAQALRHTTVAVGNLDECEVATGEREPYAAARALIAAGVELAVVKQGPQGVLAMDRDGTAVEVPPVPVDVVNGLGAGDAFGGALCHGLLSGWDTAWTVAFANAAGAIVAGRLACSEAMPTEAEVEDKLREARLATTAPADERKRDDVLSDHVSRIVDARVKDPGAIAAAAARRVRATSLLGEHGKAMIIAADHPARGANGVGGNPTAMADRFELLDRLCVALERPGVTGVLATADILEDLLLLGVLDGKTVFGSMNRAGLAGSVFEIDDRFTGYDAETIAAMGFDGGKMLTRIALSDPATPSALAATARAVDELNDRRLIALIEPFLSDWHDGRVRNDLSTEAVVTSVTIASGLGRRTAYTWLKLPVVPDMERVLASSTLPALLLGGEVTDPEAAFASWGRALKQPTAQGLVVGRSLLHPSDGDVAGAVDKAVSLL